ncbi:MAG: glycosyltransferase [Clostridia bacterium]|nr:glycosyltransferase [Clostridia bacterium]
MPQPKVSIIVPVYNAEKYLERCISSLQKQTLQEIEIILVDDASTDNSLAICKEKAERDARIKVIHKENEGAGYARNTALKMATGEYIGFLDSDDFVAPEMFQTLCDKAEQYSSDLVMSGVLFVDGNMFSEKGECERKTYFEEDTHFDTEESLKKLRMGIVGATPEDADDSKYGMSIWKNLFRRAIIEQNNLSFQSEREMLSEDALFMVDYIACIRKATGIRKAFYHYCRNASSISKAYKKDRFEKSLVFIKEVERRFEKDIKPEEYRIYINRFWQAMCRVICAQEILYAAENKIKFSDLKKRLKAVCTHPQTVSTLKTYPLGTLPLKQRVFAYGMKYRMFLLLKILVGLRSK